MNEGGSYQPDRSDSSLSNFPLGNLLCLLPVHKTEEEIQEALARKEEKLQLKAQRRQKQEADVAHKKTQKQAHR